MSFNDYENIRYVQEMHIKYINQHTLPELRIAK